ncbi:DMT family transporter [Pararhizobium haloflavum]|uniref:DMT family transporter n=1 Tax=Pararhizobium haloflavum TaxID=2037914 RepID=UPI000C191CBE|nr:DMT family transporter [Pararhizobium haloflavum]
MPLAVSLTTIAMVAFAANSLLARLALVDGAMDAAGFTAIRLGSGALVLALLLLRRRKIRPVGVMPGNWPSSVALLVYAVAFSFAYLDLGAGMGALILFTAVQATMISWGLYRGERPGLAEIAGMVLALAGFVYLVSPGLVAPDPLAAVLMVASGIAWGIYSLRGRGSDDPAGDTAGNFIRTAPVALVLLLGSVAAGGMTLSGIALSVASGALASAGGYIIWYRALPMLAATKAAIVQLTVPVVTAVGGLVFIGEQPSMQLAVAGCVILGGVALAILAKDRRK